MRQYFSRTFLFTFITHFFIGCSLIIVMVVIPLSGSTIYQLDNISIGLSLLKVTAFIGVGSLFGIFFSKISTSLTMILGSIFISMGTFLYSKNLDIPTDQINIIFYVYKIIGNNSAK